MIKPAEGVEGVLIRTKGNTFMFRVYDENHEFIDYEIMHSDLVVKIVDKDSALYSGEHGLLSDTLDHSVATLEQRWIGEHRQPLVLGRTI